MPNRRLTRLRRVKQNPAYCFNWGAVVGKSGRARSRAGSVAAVILLSAGLSGCIAAAAPLMPLLGVGMAAASGFETFKVVQLSSGGSVSIEFPGKDGKTIPPAPIPKASRVAVWPGDEGDVHLAERLGAAGLKVSSPATVGAALSADKLPTDLKNMTSEDQHGAFETVCRHTHAELVFASVDEGRSSNTNSFSFSSANITLKARLLVYSCLQKSVVWQDELVAIVNIGGSAPSGHEINVAASDAWADRVLQAMNVASSANKGQKR